MHKTRNPAVIRVSPRRCIVRAGPILNPLADDRRHLCTVNGDDALASSRRIDLHDSRLETRRHAVIPPGPDDENQVVVSVAVAHRNTIQCMQATRLRRPLAHLVSQAVVTERDEEKMLQSPLSDATEESIATLQRDCALG